MIYIDISCLFKANHYVFKNILLIISIINQLNSNEYFIEKKSFSDAVFVAVCRKCTIIPTAN